jgi:hypothetical protein
VRHGLKDRFPVNGMLALRAGRRRIGPRDVKGPAVRRAGLRAAASGLRVGTMVNVRLVDLKAAAIALRVAQTATAAKALHAGLKAAANAARAPPADPKEARIAVTVPRAVTTANAARSAARARVPVVRRKVDRAASVRRATPRIGRASAVTVAPRKNAVAASAGRAAIAHRAVSKASATRPGVVSALSRNPSKAATAIARTVRRAHRATTAANGHRPNANSATVRRVPANVPSGVNARLAVSTRHCRPPAAALAMTIAPYVPTSHVARRRQTEPNATPMTPRARLAAITKTHRVPCACPS